MRTGDKGRDKEGGEKGNFEPGSDVTAKATVLAEGCWGHLTGAALKGLGLAAEDPQVWALGVKEVWEVEQPLDKVIHTLGWPLRPQAKYKEFGGSWIYPMNREGETPRVSIGFVAGLDWADARLSPHDVLQEFKLHPRVRKILEGGKRVGWGAKAIPEGGYWAIPKLHAPGLVICGDSAGMVNVPKLKGVHYAIKSGMLAAETIYRQLKAGSTDFSSYEDGRLRVRDRQGPLRVAQHEAAVRGGLDRRRRDRQRDVVTKGRFPGGHWATHRDADQPLLMTDRHKRYPKPDGKYTFDKLSGVFLTGNATRDDAPSHIRIEKHVPREVAEAWQWMCPAGVYEVPEDAPETGDVDLIVNPSNCVQCGAITAKGGRLTPPEGGRWAAVPGDVSGAPSDRRSAPLTFAPQLHDGQGVNCRRPCADSAHNRRARSLAACSRPAFRGRRDPPRAATGHARLLACDSALDPADRMATFEGRMRTVRGATRLQMRFTLQTRGKGQGELARAAGPRLRQVAEQRARRRPLRLHEARRAPARAGVLPHLGALPLDRARRQAHRLGPRDLADLPPGRPAAQPAPARDHSRAGADARHARYVVPVVNRGKTAAGAVRRRRHRRRHDAHARADARARARRARARRGRGPAVHGRLDADRRRRPHRRGRRARARPTTARP